MQNYTIPSVFTAIDKYTKPMRQMQLATRGFSNAAVASVERINRKFNKLLPSVSQAGHQLISFASTAAAAGAIVAGVGFSINAVKDYENAIASAKAITGKLTDEAFLPYKKQIESVASVTKNSAIEVAKGFEIVGSAKSELLENAAALAATTEAAITLSKASGDDLQSSAQSLVGVMNQFSLGADQAKRTMNVLAAGSVVGAANITNVAESMKNFGAVAAGANMSVEESVALIEVLSKFTIVGAEAGTKLRSVILRLQKANLGYASGQFNTNAALIDARKKMEMLGTAFQKDQFLAKTFGAENVSVGKTLLNNIAMFNDYTQSVTGTNTAVEQAGVKSNTLTNRLMELQARWVNLITASGQAGNSLNFAKRAVVFMTDNLGALVKWASYSIAAFIGLKAIMFLVTAGMIIYNTGLGISTALTKGNAFALRGNTIALKAYGAITKTATAIQWALNTALYGIPIFWVITGILLLLGAVTLIIKKWDTWGETVAMMIPFFGTIISLIQSFRKNWDMVVSAFESGGILNGLKAIGKVLLDALLVPFQNFLSLISKIPGLDFGDDLAKAIGNYRTEVLGTTDAGRGRAAFEEYYAVNPEKSRQESLSRTLEEKRSTVDVNFGNIPAGTTIAGDGLAEMFPKLTPSFSLP